MRNKILFLVTFVISITSFSYANLILPILNVQHWQLGAGTKIYFVNAPHIPMVDIITAFQAGSDRDGPHYGLASLTANMLGEAAKNLNADEIADKIDSLGIKFDVSTNKDMTMVHMRSLTNPNYLQPSLKLFINLIAHASFPEKTFIRVQNNTLQAIAATQQDPNQIAVRNFAATIFKGNPYAHDPLGNTDTINQLTPIEATDFYKKYYVNQNAIIVIVGNLTDLQAKAIGSEIAAALPKGKAAPDLTMVKNNKAAIKHISFPVNQTSIQIGEVGVSYKEALNHALIVGNHILGSGMTSRLFHSVRGQYGLTYGIGSYFIPLANRGEFIINLQTKTDQVKQAIEITRQVVENYLETGPTPQELKAAKDYLIGNFPLKIESNASIANYVLITAFYHLPLDYLDNYTKNIEAVTAEQAKAAMNKYVHPKDFVVVTVGKTHVVKKS
jgi:zinc protease